MQQVGEVGEVGEVGGMGKDVARDLLFPPLFAIHATVKHSHWFIRRPGLKHHEIGPTMVAMWTDGIGLCCGVPSGFAPQNIRVRFGLQFTAATELSFDR